MAKRGDVSTQLDMTDHSLTIMSLGGVLEERKEQRNKEI